MKSSYKRRPVRAQPDGRKRINKVVSPFFRIQNLPVEIIILIWSQYIDMGGSPWILTKVCRSWNRFAISTHSFWSRILITDYSVKTLPASSLAGSTSAICTNIKALDKALERAGNSPLTITLQFRKRQPSGTHLLLMESLFEPNANVIPQIAHLHLGCNGDILLSFLSRCPGTRFSSLQSLVISEGNMRNAEIFLDFLKRTALKLRELEVCRTGRIPTAWIETSDRHNELWSRLKRISHGESDTLLSLPRCVSLEGLTCLSRYWPSASTLQSSFKLLRMLELYTHDLPSLARLQFPVLAHLKLCSNYTTRSSQLNGGNGHRIHLPSLTLLEASISSVWFITVLKAPNLQDLRLQIPLSAPEWGKGSLSQIKSAYPAYPPDFSILPSLQNIHFVILEGPRDPILTCAITKLMEYGCFPSLQEFRFISRMNPRYSKCLEESLLQSLVVKGKETTLPTTSTNPTNPTNSMVIIPTRSNISTSRTRTRINSTSLTHPSHPTSVDPPNPPDHSTLPAPPALISSPTLQRLYIGDESNLATSDKWVVAPLIRSVLASRRAAGHPMEKIVVHWGDRITIRGGVQEHR